MIDPSAFSTALWTVLVVAAVTVAFGLAALSDMALRRREDRAARAEERRRDSERGRGAAHQEDYVRWRNPDASVNGHNAGANGA